MTILSHVSNVVVAERFRGRWIIPDIVAKDIDSEDEALSCSKGTLIDVKTLSPGYAYPDDRTGKFNVTANARQVRVD